MSVHVVECAAYLVVLSADLNRTHWLPSPTASEKRFQPGYLLPGAGTGLIEQPH